MAEGTPDLSGLLSGLLANPAALSSVLGLLGNLGGNEAKRPPPPPEAEKGERKEEHGGEPQPALPAFAIAEDGGGRRRGKHERECLIGALAPYLSPERRRAAEGACKLLEVLELFEGRRER